MKKITLLLILAAAGSQLKAQQLPKFTPDKKLFADTIAKAWPKASENVVTSYRHRSDTTYVYSNMPVIKQSSHHKTPVVNMKTAPGDSYTMPVKRVKVVKPDTNNRPNP